MTSTIDDPGAAVTPDRTDGGAFGRVSGRAVAIATVVAAVVPVVIAAGRAVMSDWVPIGDDAYFTVRSRDVLTDHHPLLGAWSSGSNAGETLVNNLGPLQLDLLAPFTKLSPMAGTAIGVAIVNVAAILTIAWLAKRIGGLRCVAPAMAATAALTWSMGSEMLITPRQHQFLLLTFLAFLVAAWAFASGDTWALVVVVAAGSLLLQTHLSYPLLVAPVVVTAAGLHVLAHRRSGAPLDLRPVWWSLGLGAVLWCQTLYDQVAGRHNVTSLFSSTGGSDAGGLRDGLRIASMALSPHLLVRDRYRSFDPNAALPALVVAAVVVVVALAVFAILAIREFRQQRWVAVNGLALGAIALVCGVVDAAMLPRTVFGLQGSSYRWVWALGAFYLLGILMYVAVRVPARVRGNVGGAMAVAVVVLALANLPASVQVREPGMYVHRQEQVDTLVAELGDGLAASDVAGPVTIDETNMFFGHPYTYPLLLALQSEGIEFVFDDPINLRRFGEGRDVAGRQPTTLVLWHGTEAERRREDGSLVVAYADGLETVAVTLERP